MFVRRTFAIVVALALLAGIGCSKSDKTEQGAQGSSSEKVVALNGAGATFPYPLYSKWMSEYNRENPNIRINYQSIGSGGGIRQIIAGTVDFGASDAAMEPDEVKKVPRKLFHIPATIGAVAVAYNVPGIQGELKLTPEVLADIYLGKIKKWNDPRIKEANPDLAFPDQNISVVYRTDGSGTTAVFTDYLASVSEEWKRVVGVGKSVKWPVGLGAKGNEGVTGQTKTTPGAIGYIEVAYAKQNKLPMATIRNKSGNFIAPTQDAVTAAAEGVDLPESLHASIVNSDGEKAYPISAYTYLLVYEDLQDPVKGEALARFLWWAIHDGQKFANDLDYAPLPAKVTSKVQAVLKELRAGDKKLLSGA